MTTRFALITTAAIGVILAIAAERALALPGPRLTFRLPRVPARFGVSGIGLALLGVITATLIPVTPRPMQVVASQRIPRFFTSGTWQQYVTGDQAVMGLPATWQVQVAAMRWSAAENLEFRITDGYFLGPIKDDPREWGTLNRTDTLVARLSEKAYLENTPIPATEADRALARDELRRAKVAILVMRVSQHRRSAISATVEALVGPGQQVADVWLWDVRRI